MTEVCKLSSPLGMLYLTAGDRGLTGLWFERQQYFGSAWEEFQPDYDLASAPEVSPGQKAALPENLRDACRWLELYFAGKQPDFLPPLAPEGSPFRQAVWQQLLTIPYGTTTTYGAIAGRLEELNSGKRVSAQAVGGAVGHNPIGIIIPCHRVIGSDGSLTGYAGGLDKKEWLLQLEGSLTEPINTKRYRRT